MARRVYKVKDSRFYACVDKDNNPLGYVRADDIESARIKGKEKYPTFKQCYFFNGIL